MLPSLARVHVLKATEVLGTCGACKPAGTPGTRHRFKTARGGHGLFPTTSEVIKRGIHTRHRRGIRTT